MTIVSFYTCSFPPHDRNTVRFHYLRKLPGSYPIISQNKQDSTSTSIKDFGDLAFLSLVCRLYAIDAIQDWISLAQVFMSIL